MRKDHQEEEIWSSSALIRSHWWDLQVSLRFEKVFDFWVIGKKKRRNQTLMNSWMPKTFFNRIERWQWLVVSDLNFDHLKLIVLTLKLNYCLFRLLNSLTKSKDFHLKLEVINCHQINKPYSAIAAFKNIDCSWITATFTKSCKTIFIE